MNIVHVIWSLGTGGTESMLADIVNEQVKTNRVSVIIVNDLISEDILKRIDKKCQIYFCNRKTGSKNPLPLIKFNLLLWKLSPQIIHSHMDNLGRFIKLRRVAKVVRTIHCAMGDGHDNKYYDKLYAISEGVQKYTLKQGYESTVVYNGIRTELISAKSNESLCAKPIRIVNVGRLQEVKGQHILIEAAQKLIDMGYKDFSIDLIGDGENRATLEVLVEKLGLKTYVNFLGKHDRNYIYSNLKNYDLYIQPSLSEGFGLTLSEAMTAGVPVVTSDQEGPLEVIGHGKHGLYFKTGDALDLAKKIIYFIENPSCIDTSSARNFIMDNFDIKNTASRYIEEYHKLQKKS